MDNIDKKALGSALIGGGIVLVGGKVVDYIRGKIIEHKVKKAFKGMFSDVTFGDVDDFMNGRNTKSVN